MFAWWAVASFAVHPDIKGHTGGVLSMGQDAVYGTSTRQKLIIYGTFASLVFWPHDRKFMYIGLYLTGKTQYNALFDKYRTCVTAPFCRRSSSSKVKLNLFPQSIWLVIWIVIARPRNLVIALPARPFIQAAKSRPDLSLFLPSEASFEKNDVRLSVNYGSHSQFHGK
jgi:hypothetical protein